LQRPRRWPNGLSSPSQPDHHLHHPRQRRPLHRAQRAAAAIPPGPSHRHPEVSGATYDGVRPGTATGWRASPLEPFALAPWRADGEAPRPPPSGPAPTARSDSGRGGSPGQSPARIRLSSPAATHVPQRGEFRFPGVRARHHDPAGSPREQGLSRCSVHL
jgi:hypothetical protein